MKRVSQRVEPLISLSYATSCLCFIVRSYKQQKLIHCWPFLMFREFSFKAKFFTFNEVWNYCKLTHRRSYNTSDCDCFYINEVMKCLYQYCSNTYQSLAYELTVNSKLTRSSSVIANLFAHLLSERCCAMTVWTICLMSPSSVQDID